jgi:Tol biopolymer transport system component
VAFTSGTRLGPYEIVCALGAGGMGEVYRARDTKLGRDVALKVIPDIFALDPDRLARFQREAQVLASLNHPHIGAIYGFEDRSEIHALVLELVEGDTLADRISGGPIPLDDALPIARQICEALGVAHEQGIIHRDLKPSNIKITPDGIVKVLDFGLAKLNDPNVSKSRNVPNGLSQSPTITSPAMMTGVGVLLGTAAYMAPEQAKGREADKRSDIWAFGCVFYEMLTGQQPFAGEDVSDTLANVLKREADLNVLPAGVPPAIRALVQRCLVKDRRQRIADIGVAQFLLTEPAGLTTEIAAPQVVQRELPRKRSLAIATAVLLTALVLGMAFWILRPAATPTPPVVRFTVLLPEGQQFSSAARQVVAISPDGTQFVYVANSQLYRRSIGELEAQPILGTNLSALYPVFSPDGGSIAFYAGSEGTLKRIPVTGGTPATIARAGPPFGISWGEDGIVFGGGSEGIFRVSPTSGAPEQLVSVSADQLAHGPQILPGGKFVLFTLATGTDAGRWDAAEIVVQSLTSRERRTIIKGGSDGRYVPSGHLIYAVSGSLFAVAFDPLTQTVGGAPVSVLVGVGRSVPTEATGTAKFSVSETGSLVYVAGPADTSSNLRTLVLSDRNGVSVPLKLPPRNYAHPRVSHDGARLAVGIDGRQEAHVWIYDLAGTSTIRRLTLQGHNRYPVWSHNGHRLAFQSDRQGDLGIFSQSANGGGEVERLTTAPQGTAHVPESWSPDGEYLLFTEQKGSSYILFSLSLADKKFAQFGNVRSSAPTSASFSPDGRWVTYSQNAGGLSSLSNGGVFIQPFPATGEIYPVPKTRLDFHPVWSPDGKELFYVSAAALPFVAVSFRTQSGVTFGPPAEVSQAVPRPRLTLNEVRGYDLLPNGKFLSLVPEGDQDIAGLLPRQQIEVVLNWFEELKRLVPTN